MARKKDEALAEKRKVEILDAAAACFVEHGIHQASMRQICTRANLSAGAVYNYYASKDDIIEAMAKREFEEIHEISAYLEKSRNAFKAITQVVDWIIEETTTSQAQLQIEILAEASRNEMVHRHLATNDKAITACFTRAIERGQQEGTIGKHLPIDGLVKIVVTTYEGFLGRLAVEDKASKKDMRKLSKHMLTRLLKP